MKKLFICLFQIFSFLISYYVVTLLLHFAFDLLIMLISEIPILRILFPDLFLEGIRFIFIPLTSGFTLVLIERLITIKTNLYFPSYIIIMAICICLNANMVVSSLIQHGLISWNFANILCYAVVLCGILGYGLLQQINSIENPMHIITFLLCISAIFLIVYSVFYGVDIKVFNRDQTEYVYVKEDGKFYHNGTCGMSKDKNKMDKVSKGFAMLEEYEKCTYCDW